MLRPELMRVARALLTREGVALSLDDVAEALGSLRVTPVEIELLLDWLEAEGRPIPDPVGPSAAALLGDVLITARALHAELGRAPKPGEIAARSSLSVESVQRALWFARILQR